MSETTKKSAKPTGAAQKTAIGVVFIFLGVVAVLGWWPQVIDALKGLSGLVLILFGALAILVARQ